MGAVAVVAGLAAAVTVAAAVLLLPGYVQIASNVDLEIEEWSAPAPAEWAVLSPKGMAAAVLEPNEVLAGPGSEQGSFVRLQAQ